MLERPDWRDFIDPSPLKTEIQLDKWYDSVVAPVKKKIDSRLEKAAEAIIKNEDLIHGKET